MRCCWCIYLNDLLFCLGLVLLLWDSCYVVFPFLVHEEAYTCLSVVGLRVVQHVATLESVETFLFSLDFSEPSHVPFHVVFFQFLHVLVFLVMFLHCMLPVFFLLFIIEKSFCTKNAPLGPQKNVRSSQERGVASQC